MCISFAINVSICKMLFLTCTEHTSTMSPELMKLGIMTISIKTKVLINFGTSEMMCVELKQKAMKYVLFEVNVCICEMLFLTCTGHISTTLPVNEAQDYDY